MLKGDRPLAKVRSEKPSLSRVGGNLHSTVERKAIIKSRPLLRGLSCTKRGRSLAGNGVEKGVPVLLDDRKPALEIPFG